MNKYIIIFTAIISIFFSAYAVSAEENEEEIKSIINAIELMPLPTDDLKKNVLSVIEFRTTGKILNEPNKDRIEIIRNASRLAALIQIRGLKVVREELLSAQQTKLLTEIGLLEKPKMDCK